MSSSRGVTPMMTQNPENYRKMNGANNDRNPLNGTVNSKASIDPRLSMISTISKDNFFEQKNANMKDSIKIDDMKTSKVLSMTNSRLISNNPMTNSRLISTNPMSNSRLISNNLMSNSRHISTNPMSNSRIYIPNHEENYTYMNSLRSSQILSSSQIPSSTDNPRNHENRDIFPTKYYNNNTAYVRTPHENLKQHYRKPNESPISNFEPYNLKHENKDLPNYFKKIQDVRLQNDKTNLQKDNRVLQRKVLKNTMLN